MERANLKGKEKMEKGKGFSQWNSNFKGKRKGKDFSTGKSDLGGKGSNQSGYQKLDPNQCAYCFKFGHRKADCRKMQSDKAAGGVRQINDTNADTVDDSSTVYNGSSNGASSSNAPASQSNVRNIRAISRVGLHVPSVQDLTAFEQNPCVSSDSASRICVVQCHDMSCTDDDDDDDDGGGVVVVMMMTFGRIHHFFLQVVIFSTYVPFLQMTMEATLLKSCWIQVLIQVFAA